MEDSKEINKPIILSGIQPSGDLHLGHLTGALQNWVRLQDDYECFFTIVDLHAITVRQEPAQLRRLTLDLAAAFLACGIDSERSTLFVQSHVPEHTQLAWVLNCFTGMGECGKMTQYKDKSLQHSDNINVGLFAYPVLMAADILLYQADLVPVGEDQKQHLELTRNLAIRFNHYYSETFKIPEPYIPKVGARIMNLQEPTKKMSKSDDNKNSTLLINDSEDEIRNKIKRAVTDSGNQVQYSPDKPGVANLMTLYSIATGKSYEDIEVIFAGKGYGQFKQAVGDAVSELLRPIRTRYTEIRGDKTYLAAILSAGAEKARRYASKTLYKVYKKVGLIS